MHLVTDLPEITSAQVAVYLRFGGDEDLYVLMASVADKHLMRDGTWARLNALVTESGQLQRGILAAQYAERVARSLIDAIPDLEARTAIVRFAAPRA